MTTPLASITNAQAAELSQEVVRKLLLQMREHAGRVSCHCHQPRPTAGTRIAVYPDFTVAVDRLHQYPVLAAASVDHLNERSPETEVALERSLSSVLRGAALEEARKAWIDPDFVPNPLLAEFGEAAEPNVIVKHPETLELVEVEVREIVVRKSEYLWPDQLWERLGSDTESNQIRAAVALLGAKDAGVILLGSREAAEKVKLPERTDSVVVKRQEYHTPRGLVVVEPCVLK